MPYKIENVSVDRASYFGDDRHKPGVAHYPIRDLELGQSFAVPRAEAKFIKNAVKHANAVSAKDKIDRRYRLVVLVDGSFRVGRIR